MLRFGSKFCPVFFKSGKRQTDKILPFLITKNLELSVNEQEELFALLEDFKATSANLLTQPASLKKQLLAGIPGLLTNTVVYCGLMAFAPEYALAGLVSSLSGAIAHIISHKAAAIDGTKGVKAAVFNIAHSIFYGTLAPEALRMTLSLATAANPIAGKIVPPFLSILNQLLFMSALSKNRASMQKLETLTEIATRIQKFREKMGTKKFIEVFNQLIGSTSEREKIYLAIFPDATLEERSMLMNSKTDDFSCPYPPGPYLPAFPVVLDGENPASEIDAFLRLV